MLKQIDYQGKLEEIAEKFQGRKQKYQKKLIKLFNRL